MINKKTIEGESKYNEAIYCRKWTPV